MKDSKVARMQRGAIALRHQFAQRRGGVFGHVLGDAEIASVVSTHVKNYRERIYPPLDTLRLFIGQVLSADRACQDVVGRRLSERVARQIREYAQYRFILRCASPFAGGDSANIGQPDRRTT